jgi:hypothetical protein
MAKFALFIKIQAQQDGEEEEPKKKSFRKLITKSIPSFTLSRGYAITTTHAPGVLADR